MERFKLLAGCFLLLCPILYSQENVEAAKMLVEIADEAYYVQHAMDVAKDQYVMAVELDPGNIKANWMAGETHLQTVHREQATPYYLKVFDMDPDYHFDLLYKIGLSYQLGLDFDKALEHYHAYKKKVIDQVKYRGKDKVKLEVVERRIFECENGKQLVANPVQYSITNLGSKINSEWPDYGAVINEDETIMIFTSRRKDGNLNEDVFEDNFPYEDIFISKKENGEWSYAVLKISNPPIPGPPLLLK